LYADTNDWREIIERVAIIGSRNWPHPEAVEQYVDTLAPGTIVISGGAAGVDTWAEEAARVKGLEVIVIEPEWHKHGLSAGMRRNTDIVEACDRVVAFIFNNSAGSRATVTIAGIKGKPTTVFRDKS